MDGALVVAIVAAVFAGLAAIFAGWSAWSSHRSAQLAAEAVKLERDRHHRELTPRLALAHDGTIGGEDEGIWFTNRGPLAYEWIEFMMTQDDEDRPIAGFVQDEEILTYGNLGSLPVGERRFLPVRRPAPNEGGGTLYLNLECHNDQGTWTVPAEVDIPAVPQVFFAWE